MDIMNEEPKTIGLEMQITDANTKEVSQGERKGDFYFSIKMHGKYEGKDLVASINVDASEKNKPLIVDAVNNKKTVLVKFLESSIKPWDFNGQSGIGVKSKYILNRREIKDALGLPKLTVDDKLKINK